MIISRELAYKIDLYAQELDGLVGIPEGKLLDIINEKGSYGLSDLLQFYALNVMHKYSMWLPLFDLPKTPDKNFHHCTHLDLKELIMYKSSENVYRDNGEAYTLHFDPQFQLILSIASQHKDIAKIRTNPYRWEFSKPLPKYTLDQLRSAGVTVVIENSHIDRGLWVETSGQEAHVYFPYREWLTNYARLSGGYFNGRAWVFNLSNPDHLQVIHKIVNEYGFICSDEDLARLGFSSRPPHFELFELSNALEPTKTVKLTGKFELYMKPKQHQLAAVQYLQQTNRAIVGDDKGSGKGLIMLMMANVINQWPVLIYAKPRLLTMFADEIEKAFGGLARVHICSGRSDHVPNDVDFVLTHPDLLGQRKTKLVPGDIIIDDAMPVVNHEELKGRKKYTVLTETGKQLYHMRFNVVLADEVHMFKNREAIRSKAGAVINWNADFVYGATATITPNNLFNLWGISMFIGFSKLLGNKKDFSEYFCGGYLGQIGKRRFWVDYGWRNKIRGAAKSGSAAVEKVVALRNHRAIVLGNTLRSQGLLLRRTINQIQPQLEPITINSLRVVLDNEDEYIKEERAFLDGVGQYTRKDFNEQYAQVFGLLSKLWQMASIGKVEAITDLVSEYIESETKLVVYNYHIEAQKAMHEQFPDQAFLTGPTPDQDKKDFQTKDEPLVIFGSLSADAEGHTLTAAWNMLFNGLSLNAGIVSQALGRCYGRTNDPHHVTATFILGKGTVDEDMFTLFKMKMDEQALLQDGVLPSTDFEPDDLYGLVERMKKRHGI